MFLLDTNIISELMKKQPSSYLLEKMEDVSDNPIYTASVYTMELRYGALRVPNGEALWSKIQKRILSRNEAPRRKQRSILFSSGPVIPCLTRNPVCFSGYRLSPV